MAELELSLGWVIVCVDDPHARVLSTSRRSARALHAGCISLAPPQDKPHGQRVAYLCDPFGTLIELATPL